MNEKVHASGQEAYNSVGVGLVMMKEESNEGGNECTQLPPCPCVETEN